MESAPPPESRSPLGADEFLTICDIIQADLMAAETPEQFDKALTGFVLIVQEQLPNAADAARAIGAFMRGVLEGAGCKFPWNANRN